MFSGSKGKSAGGWKDKKSFGDKKPYGRDSAPKQMHSATCATCGNACEVPFKPNGRKPVFCSNCFVRDESVNDSYGEKPSYGEKRERTEKRPYEKPVQSYGGSNSNGQDLREVTEQLRSVNTNLQAILKALTAVKE